MTRRRYALALALALPLIVAAAPRPETREDVRCFLAASSMMSSDKPELKMFGSMAAQYFLGRIDGREPGVDIEAITVEEGPSMTQADVSALLRSCGALMQKRGNEIQAIG